MKKALFIVLLLGMTNFFQVQAIFEPLIGYEDGIRLSDSEAQKLIAQWLIAKREKRKKKAEKAFLIRWAGGKGQTDKMAHLPNHSHTER